MIKRIIAVMVVLILSGGIAAPAREAAAETASSAMDTIPPFEKEQREILPLPDVAVFSGDSLEFVDTLIDAYEVVHVQELDQNISLRDVTVAICGDGYMLTGLESEELETGAAALSRTLDAYFDTAMGSFAVLVRFRSDAISGLRFICDSRFGRMMLDFYEGLYPAIDSSGDASGVAMLNQKWNNYVYQPGEWAYVFLSISNTGQKNCYIWAEDDINDYNTQTAYGENTGGGSFAFSIELSAQGEAVTISDIWIYAFARMKR